MNQPLLDHATRTMAVGSKSFDTAAKLFDAETRRSALMLYAWCRHCDDVIDDQALGFTGAASATDARERLANLEAQTRQAYTGEPMQDPAFAALQEVAIKHAIPPRRAFEHLEGFAMDVRKEHYATLEDTLRYCYHVAGVVGLMMAQVMGVRNERVLDRACDLGLALQLTNIARDIIEDAHVGRCYLPASWLAEERLRMETLSDPACRPQVARLAERLVSEAEPYYASAKGGLCGLPLRSAWAIATAHGVYRKIGLKVQRAGAYAWDKRQSTTRLEKAVLLAKGSALALSSRVATPTPRPPGLWQRPA